MFMYGFVGIFLWVFLWDWDDGLIWGIKQLYIGFRNNTGIEIWNILILFLNIHGNMGYYEEFERFGDNYWKEMRKINRKRNLLKKYIIFTGNKK